MLIPDAADVMHISQAEGEQSVHSLINIRYHWCPCYPE